MKRIPHILAFLALNLTTVCHATDYVWTGAGKDGFWDTAANWKPATGYPRSGDSAEFPETSANVTVNLHGDQAVRSVTFDPVANFSYTIAGDTLTLDDGGEIHFSKLAKGVGMGKSAVQVIESDLRLSGSATFSNENRWYLGGERLRIPGQIIGGGTITIGGADGGCIAFEGDNSGFTGPITIETGMLYATHRAALGSGTQDLVMNGGGFWVSSLPTARNFRIAGDAAWSATVSPSGPHSGTIAVKKGATWKYGAGGNSSTLLGPVTGEGSLVVSAGVRGTTIGGTAPNTLRGDFAVEGGLVILAKPDGVDAVSGALTVRKGATLRWDADEQIADRLPLTLGGDQCALDLNGHRESLGTLDLQGHAVIECSDGSDVLHADDSRGMPWDDSKELVVNQWKGSKHGGGVDRIVFGNGADSLTAGQLARVGFRDPAGHPAGLYTAGILKTGELVPAAAVRPVNPPYDLSEEARAERRKLYEVAGRANLAGPGTPLKKGMKIAFFGDSITWGGGYIGVIDRSLKAGEGTRDLGITLINHGVNGGGVLTLRDGDEGTAHAGGTKPRPFAEYLAEDRPDVAVIFIGVNDIWWRKTSPEDFEKALRDLVAAAKARGSVPVLATLAVWGDSPAADNANNPKCDEYAGITRKVAAATGVTLVDLRKAFVAYLRNHNPELRLDGSLRFSPTGVLTGDGVHTNAKGTELLADLISRGILEALRK